MGGPERDSNGLNILLISPLEGDFFPTEVTSIESVIRLATPDTAQIRVFNQSNLGELEVDKISESHIIISGSDKSVHEGIPHKEKIADIVNMARDKGRKLLGICWGHQFIAERLGGEVFVAKEYPDVPFNPEFGVLPLKLTKAGKTDPAFRGINDTSFYTTHLDHVKQPPFKCKRVQVLAETALYPNQVLRIDDHILTTQMHPELIKIQVMHFIDHTRAGLIKLLGKDKFKEDLGDWPNWSKESVQEHFRQAEANGLKFMRNFYYGSSALPQQLTLDIFSETDLDEVTPEVCRELASMKKPDGEKIDGESDEGADDE